MDILYKHLVEAPRPLREHEPSLPLHIESAVLRALSKNKAERFASMEAFIVALSQEDEDATRLRRILPTPQEEAQARPNEDLEESTEDMSRELKQSTAQAPPPKAREARGEKITLNEKPRHHELPQHQTSTIPLGTTEIELVEPTLNVHTGDIILELPRPRLEPKPPAPLFTLSPAPVSTKLPTKALPMRGEIPADSETPPTPIPLFGEVQAAPRRSRQRLMMGLVLFLLLWGVVVVVLIFSAPKQPTAATAAPLAPRVELPPQAPPATEQATSQAASLEVLPSTAPATPLTQPTIPEIKPNPTPNKQNKQKPKKSKKKGPIIKGNPDLD